MKVKIESSRIIKPFYEGKPPPTTSSIPLTVFDKVSYDLHIAVIFAYCPPTPPNVTIEFGLRKALVVYREWAGRLTTDEKGEPVILLNDDGVRFVEASVDSTLDQAMPLKPSPMLLNLYPSLTGVAELIQVQLTRFTCGSLVVGFTSHHLVADGESVGNFVVAWGQACRGLDISPLPWHDRTIFAMRNPPMFDFEHNGVEFTSKNVKEICPPTYNNNTTEEDIILHKVHYTTEFLSELKSKASSNKNKKSYTTFESQLAHLWRTITKARGLSPYETTKVRISVNGRMRLNPKILEYFGNLVLWAFPTAKVKDLLRERLPYTASLIHDAVSRVNDTYFKSFIDFANDKVKEDNLVPTANMNKSVLCLNLEVDSWLRIPFYDMDFGHGCPYIFMPSYFPREGMVFLLPSFIGDGSVEAYIPLFRDSLPTFKQVCYSLD